MNKIDFKSKKWAILNKSFLRTIIVLSLIQFSTVGVGVIDGIITSHFIGTDAMAGIGLGYPVFCIAGIISALLANGLIDFCAQQVGRGNFKKFSEGASFSINLGLISSIFLMILLIIVKKPLVILLGARDVTSNLFFLTLDYVKGIIWGIPGLVTGTILAGSIQLDGGERLVVRASVISAITDILLDLLAVKMNTGLYGIGLASSISYYIYLVILLLHFTKKERKLRYIFLKKEHFLMLKTILTNGSPSFSKQIGSLIRPIVLNNYFMILGGTIAVSAISIKNNICQFYDIFALSIAGAVSLVTGIAVGEKSIDDILHIGKLVHRYAIVGNLILAIFLIAFSNPIADFYNMDGTYLHKLIVFSLITTAIEIAFNTFIYSRISYLSSISKAKDSSLLQLSIILLVVVPVVLIMGKIYRVRGAIAGFAIASAIVLALVYLITAFRKKDFDISVKDYLRLDDSYDISPKDIIELDIKNMEDATLASEQVQMFCMGHKLERKKGYYSALAIEESIRLIYESNKKPEDISIDLKVIIKGESLIIRLRDNGDSIHPFSGVSEDDKTDPYANIGITMLRKIAKKITYYHSLQVNYTIIAV